MNKIKMKNRETPIVMFSGMYTMCLCVADSVYLVSEAMFWLNDGYKGAPTGNTVIITSGVIPCRRIYIMQRYLCF